MKTSFLTLALFVSPIGCSASVDGVAGTNDPGTPVMMAPVSASFRVANVERWMPSLDVCVGTVNAHGTVDYRGAPLLASNGRAEGVAYGEVSDYVHVDGVQVASLIEAGTPCGSSSIGGRSIVSWDVDLDNAQATP